MEDAPKVSKKVRTTTYFATLLLGGSSLVVMGVTEAFFPDLLQQISTVNASVTAAVSLVAGGLGVAYRPTADYDPQH